MARLVRGDLVVVPFPFSDLSQTKRRPALVVALLPGDDLILCQVTSKSVRDPFAVAIEPEDVESGILRQPSNARPNRLFTADRSIVLYRVGTVRRPVFDAVIDTIVKIVRDE